MEILSLEPGRAPDFELEVRIGIAPAELRAFLLDLHRYASLHPFIESIEDLPEHPALPSARLHRVVDRIPLGPLRLRAVYVAALEPVSPTEVHGHAWQSPGIRLRTEYRLDALPEGTRLSERCFVDAPALLRRFVVERARQAHGETLDGMRRLIEHSR